MDCIESPNKIYFTYSDIESDVKHLVECMESDDYLPKCKCLVAICRGGLFPTLLLSEMLACRNIKSVSIQSYDDGQTFNKELKLLNSSEIEDCENTLFVDDLYDSGQTMEFINKQYPKSKKAVVYSKTEYKMYPDKLDFPVNYVGKLLDTKDWLVFPWEEF